jgi:hypothetical protein
MTSKADTLKRRAEAAPSEYEAASAKLANLENSAPTSFLSDDELDRAVRRRGFVNDEVEKMGREELLARLEAVRSEGDRGAMLCYYQAATRRLEALGGVADPPQLEELRAALQGETRLKRIREVKDREWKAGEVELLASSLKVEARDPAEAWMHRRYGALVGA